MTIIRDNVGYVMLITEKTKVIGELLLGFTLDQAIETCNYLGVGITADQLATLDLYERFTND